MTAKKSIINKGYCPACGKGMNLSKLILDDRGNGMGRCPGCKRKLSLRLYRKDKGRIDIIVYFEKGDSGVVGKNN